MRGLLQGRKPIIAMVHVGALPGTPHSAESMSTLLRRAREDALAYRDAGADAIAVENMHDRPYLKGEAGPEVIAAMTLLAHEARTAAGLPCGVQILAGANRAALAVAMAAGLDFVRAEGFVFAHVADEGLIEAGAGELLRYRRAIGAADVMVFADVKKKHSSHALTVDVDVAETARAAEFFLADAVIVTGARSGAPADPAELAAVKKAVAVPVLVGSGVDAGNAASYLAVADGVIVGSSLKRDGDWTRPVDPERVRRLVRAVEPLRR